MIFGFMKKEYRHLKGFYYCIRRDDFDLVFYSNKKRVTCILLGEAWKGVGINQNLHRQLIELFQEELPRMKAEKKSELMRARRAKKLAARGKVFKSEVPF